ncbi:MAG: hypothetical protein RMN51_02015 [Verrucomicrobiota bacterium]|nr:hypothetical protein [Limisphaera sp.]MDW8380874.1 hypothetical protein [Verrucomicrobiota bacterium]
MSLVVASSGRADFQPIELRPESFNADVIVERTAPPPLPAFVTATMDGGTNNNAWTWYEQGYSPSHPDTGLPPAGTTFRPANDPNRIYRMPPSATGPNALLIYSAVPTGKLTLQTPAAFSLLSVVSAAGGGTATLEYTIRFQDNSTQTGTLNIYDWFNTPQEIAWIANGRVNMDNGQLGALYSGNPKLFYGDIPIVNHTTPVREVEFRYVSGSGRTAIFAISGSPDGSAWTPLELTGFSYDMIIESNAPLTGTLFGYTTAVMDGGNAATNSAGNGFYERGFNRDAPATGLPVAGTTLTNAGRAFTFASSYAQNNAFYVGPYAGYTTTTITLADPASYQALSFLSCAGNGPVVMDVVVRHADNSTEQFQISSPDWFNQPNPYYVINGRFNPSTAGFSDVNSGNPRLYTNDIVLLNVTSPVTSIDLTYVSGGRAAVFALAGLAPGGDLFLPVAVTGYNADVVVEAVAPRWLYPLTNATTVSMDGGTNNTGNTWYERGYYPQFPNTGLPPAGSLLTSQAQPDRHYRMPASYSAPNAVYVDYARPEAHLVPVNPQPYSALSFLSATANNNVTNAVVVQYADGTSETNTFVSRDWFNNAPYAFTTLGRVNLNNRTINNDPGRTTTPNPRLYEAQFALNNTVSPVTNIILRFLGAVNPTTGRMVVLAVSGTLGDFSPILSPIAPSTINVYDGTLVSLGSLLLGGTAPVSLRWQYRAPGSTTWTDLVNGGAISGADQTNLVLNPATLAHSGQYRLTATNAVGFAVSDVATLTVVSRLQDVTRPGDTIYILDGSSPAAETVDRAIDNTVQKYLNFDAYDTAPPFVGPQGFVVQPSVGATIVRGVRIYTANDVEARDPADVVIEGSNDGGLSWTLISSNALALPSGRNTVTTETIDPLRHFHQEVMFANTIPYALYRVQFYNVKNNVTANSVQIAEIELLGLVAGAEPPTLSITVGTGGSLTLSTSHPGTLQSTTSLTPPVQWQDEGPIAGTVTLMPSPEVPAKYYRVRIP